MRVLAGVCNPRRCRQEDEEFKVILSTQYVLRQVLESLSQNLKCVLILKYPISEGLF